MGNITSRDELFSDSDDSISAHTSLTNRPDVTTNATPRIMVNDLIGLENGMTNTQSAYSIVIYGDSTVGKTSLNRRLAGKPYQKLEKRTIGKNTFNFETEFFQRSFKFKITASISLLHSVSLSLCLCVLIQSVLYNVLGLFWSETFY